MDDCLFRFCTATRNLKNSMLTMIASKRIFAKFTLREIALVNCVKPAMNHVEWLQEAVHSFDSL